MTDSRTIHADQFVPRPPAAVWRALTEPGLLAKWWAAGDIEPTVGHRFTLDMGAWGQAACTVLDVRPEELISYTFAEDTKAWTLTWRLVAEGGGTRLFLEHAGFGPEDDVPFRNMSKGWAGTVLPRLVRELEQVSA